MEVETRLNLHTGSLVALETAFSLLVKHLELAGQVDRCALIGDLQLLSAMAAKDADVQRAELRLIRTLEAL